jgi:hydroxypyruvate isomerase
MIRFSANLGFLYTELSLPEAIIEAARAGFEAVECHWPYQTPASEVADALESSGLSMLGLNTQRGNTDKGDNGVAAISGREAEARDYIDESIEYAKAIQCSNVHVMAGFTDQSELAEDTFRQNLAYACDKASAHDITILIEPLNHYDAPGYHLLNLDNAAATQQAVNASNLKIMFDVYHMQIMHGDITRRLKSQLDKVGHIQIAAVPNRDEPDAGELHYPNLLTEIDKMGWTGFIGAEYKPRTTTTAGLGWLKAYNNRGAS